MQSYRSRDKELTDLIHLSIFGKNMKWDWSLNDDEDEITSSFYSI